MLVSTVNEYCGRWTIWRVSKIDMEEEKKTLLPSTNNIVSMSPRFFVFVFR